MLKNISRVLTTSPSRHSSGNRPAPAKPSMPQVTCTRIALLFVASHTDAAGASRSVETRTTGYRRKAATMHSFAGLRSTASLLPGILAPAAKEEVGERPDEVDERREGP